MEIIIKKRREILNCIIHIHFLFLFVLVSCSKSTEEQISPPGGELVNFQKKLKKEFSEAIQQATSQFKKELNKSVVKTTTEFQNQTDQILKKRKEEVQVKLDKEALTNDLDALIQKTRVRFTSDINLTIDEALARFQRQIEGILEKKKADTVTLEVETHKAIRRFNEEVSSTIGMAKKDLTEGIKLASSEARADIETGIKSAGSEARENIETGVKSAGVEARKDIETGVKSAGVEARKDIETGIKSAGSEARENIETGVKSAGVEARKDIETGIKSAGSEAREDIETGVKSAGVEARKDIEEGIKSAISETREESVTDKIPEEALAMMNIEINKITEAALDRFSREAAHLIQDAMTASEPSNPMTKARKKSQFIIQSSIQNLRIFLDRELLFESANRAKNGIVKKIFEDREIHWEQIVTEQDKKELADKIINTIYSGDEQYKYDLKNINTALMINLKDIKIPEEDTIMLTTNEIKTLTNEFNIEIKREVETFIKERIRYNVDKIIDIETATEAVYTLQFDVKSSLPHKRFGKPILLFISMGEGENVKDIVLGRKGDCVRVKKEHLPLIDVALLYTNPAITMNSPDSISQLCDSKAEKYRCRPGNYNIQQIGEEEGIDYVLRWEKRKDNRALFLSVIS